MQRMAMLPKKKSNLAFGDQSCASFRSIVSVILLVLMLDCAGAGARNRADARTFAGGRQSVDSGSSGSTDTYPFPRLHVTFVLVFTVMPVMGYGQARRCRTDEQAR